MKRCLFIALLGLWLPTVGLAQNTKPAPAKPAPAKPSQGEQISWDDEEDNSRKPDATGQWDKAIILLNDKPFVVPEELALVPGQKLNLKASRLFPHSQVVVKVYKAGSLLAEKRYDSNKFGELELDIMVPEQKIGGTTEIVYKANKGNLVTLNFRVKIGG